MMDVGIGGGAGGGAGAHAGGGGGGGDGVVLDISIKDPMTQGEGMKSYTSYKIVVKTNMTAFAADKFSVVRRFNDFVWLHDQLVDEFPCTVVPPLPDKVLVGRFTEAVVTSRQRTLEKFLQRVASRPDHRTSKSFISFLEAPDKAFSAAMAAAASKPKKSSGGSGGFMAWASSALSFGGSSAGAKSGEDLAFEEIASYIEGLEPQLTNISKHVQALVRRRNDMANGLVEFGAAFTLLGKSENGAIALAMANLGRTADSLAVVAKKHAENETIFFDDPISDYIRIVGAVKATLNYRHDAMLKHKAAVADMDAKQAAVNRHVGVAGQEAQLTAAKAKLAQATAVADAAKKELDEVSTQVLEEVERFKREKLADFRTIVLDYVQLQIDYNNRLEVAWSELIPELEAAQLRESRTAEARSHADAAEAARAAASVPPPAPGSSSSGAGDQAGAGAGAGAGAAGVMPTAPAASAPPEPPSASAPDLL